MKTVITKTGQQISIAWDELLAGFYEGGANDVAGAVVHIRVVEPFEAGRLKRAADTSLCGRIRSDRWADTAEAVPEGSSRRCPVCVQRAASMGVDPQMVPPWTKRQLPA